MWYRASKNLDRITIQRLGGKITQKLNQIKVTEVNILANDKLNVKESFFITNLCEGMKLRNYIFNKYFFQKKETNSISLKKVIISSSDPNIKSCLSDRARIVDATIL